jgi:hypothetical protein
VIFFAFSFDSPTQAALARSLLLAKQFEVDFQPQADGGVVLAVTPRTIETDPKATRARLTLLVRQFGGESLGYGGSHEVVAGG